MSPVLAGLLVFLMRVSDMSLDTLRLLFVMRGRKLLSALIGATQAAVFILAVSTVLSNELNLWTVLGYAGGFGTGVAVGMIAEEKLALGYAMFHIYSKERGKVIALALRNAGHAATLFAAQGKCGDVSVVHCAVSRRKAPAVRTLVERADPEAFITLEEVRPLRRGYFRR
ncbi:MAG: DUF2179 domain-containing protein [Anaerolineae bacterium]|nr:DUF2179 domain-containing protein [Anaerolineae bacterium]